MTRLPRLTRRWLVAAFVMAVLGFAAVSFRLFVPERILIEADSNCIPFYESLSGQCLQWAEVPSDMTGVLVAAALNAMIWFGVVYVVFLVVYGIRKATRGGSQSPAPPSSDVASANADKPEVSPGR